MEQSADEGVIIAILIPLLLLTIFSLVNVAIIVFVATRALKITFPRITAIVIANVTSMVFNAVTFYFLFFDPVSSMGQRQVNIDQQVEPIFNAVSILVFGWAQVILGGLSTISLLQTCVSKRMNGWNGTRFTLAVLFLSAHLTAILCVMVALLV